MEAHYVDLYPPHNFASISYPSTRTVRSSSAATLAPHASSPAILHPQPTTTSVGPLLGCTFYLDMSSEDPRKSSTERQLKQLAARVEDLFNGDIVTHLITTRHLTNEQKLKIQQQALSPSFSSTSLLSSSTSGSASSSSGIASSALALSSPSLALPSSSSTASSTVQPMTSAAALASLTVPSGSLAPNSPFSSSPSSPFSCHPAATTAGSSSYPPPQASSSPSSPSAMSAYPPSLRGSATGTAPGSASMAYPPQHSLIEQLRHATGATKRKESSQLALTRKVHSLPYPQAQPNDMELSEDVISLAYRLGKKIYHIDKFAPWLEKHCSPFGSSSSTSPRYGTPRRGNESAHTTAESPIGSPQAPRQMAAGCYAMAPGPSWPVKPVDAPHATTGGVMLAPIVPSLSFASGFSGSASLATPSSTATAAPVPTTTTTTTTTAKPASPTSVPSFTAPYLMVEDLKGQFKTMYKEFPFDSYGCSTVPFLNLDAPPGCSPFLDAETIRKHKEMQRQYQQKLEMRKREKPVTPRPKRPTSAPLTRRDLRRPTPRERSQPPQAPESTTAVVEMWEGEDGGGMNDSSLQVPHPYRPQMIAPVLSTAASLLPYSLSSTTTTAANAATAASSYQQRRLAPPPTAMSTSSPPAYPSAAFLSPLAAGPPPSFGAVGTPRPATTASSSASSSAANAGVSPRHAGRQHAHSSSLLARAHYPPPDHRPRHSKSLSLSAPCFSKADSSSGRADTMQSPSEEMEDDVVCLQ